MVPYNGNDIRQTADAPLQVAGLSSCFDFRFETSQDCGISISFSLRHHCGMVSVPACRVLVQMFDDDLA